MAVISNLETWASPEANPTQNLEAPGGKPASPSWEPLERKKNGKPNGTLRVFTRFFVRSAINENPGIFDNLFRFA